MTVIPLRCRHCDKPLAQHKRPCSRWSIRDRIAIWAGRVTRRWLA